MAFCCILEVIVFVFFIIFQRGVAEVQTLLYEGFFMQTQNLRFCEKFEKNEFVGTVSF